MRGKWNIMPATEQWAVRQFTDSNIFSVRTAARYIAAGIAQVSEAAPINAYRWEACSYTLSATQVRQ